MYGKVRYLDYLGMPQEGEIVFYLNSEDPTAPYLLIQDVEPSHNNKVYGGNIPYAEIRRSTEVEYLGD